MSISRLTALGKVLAGAAAFIMLPATSHADAEAIYNKDCQMCHGTGLGGAPKLGDKAAWAPRIAKGIPTLEDHALHGFKDKGLMPPKGGHPALSEDDVKAAVAYIVNGSK
jgi:cytochrome c5